ncbi:Gfo/Idh/MocA family oxidoreductase [Oscillibacter sp.]|uniref:Gfo/Idh/MocA family oxidoreductase n=1 Tax=Oscillibacter sp. TaxID=1945593 RepID=UPI00338D6D77
MPEEEQSANRAQLEDFLSSIREHRLPLVTASQSLVVMQILSGLYRSARELRPVEF